MLSPVVTVPQLPLYMAEDQLPPNLTPESPLGIGYATNWRCILVALNRSNFYIIENTGILVYLTEVSWLLGCNTNWCNER